MFRRYVFKYLVVCYLISSHAFETVAGISLDYYFGNDEPLRSSSDLKSCKTLAMFSYCYQKCGPEHACLLGQCFCIKLDVSSENNPQTSLEESSAGNTGSESYEDEDDIEETPTALDPKNFEELAARPTLRHHIAHFCPNLQKARNCIRRCMKVGKPAFCGKDHHCYCGHKYGTPETPGNQPRASDVYAQFRDLYEKYFGPRHSHLKSSSSSGTEKLKKSKKG